MSVFRLAVAAISLTASIHAAQAAGSITYTYDGRGRLVKVDHSGAVNNGLTATYGLDKADNRSAKTISSPPPGAVSFAVFDASTVEGGTLQFLVKKTGSALASHQVNYTTTAATAVTPGDFTAASGTLTFAQNESEKTVTVTTINNALPEGPEQLYLDLSAATGGATISDNRANGAIVDNDQSGGGSDCYTTPHGAIICQ